MQLKNVGKIEGGSGMLEPSTLGGEDGVAANPGSRKHRQVNRFPWQSQ